MLQFERWKVVLISIVCLLGVLFTIPNFIAKERLAGMPGWLPSQQINLGLDLRGGSYLLLEVDVTTAIEDQLQALVSEVRGSLRSEGVGYTGLGVRGDKVAVRITDTAQLPAALGTIEDLSNPVGGVFGGGGETELDVRQDGNLITIGYSEAAVAQKTRSAVQQSIEIVRRRIDELGTTEPLIQRQGEDRILVQVPGLDDPARLKALLGQTAKLNFRLVDDSMSAQEAMQTRPPVGTEVLELVEGESRQPILIERRVMVSGEQLVDAQPGFSQQTNEPIVTFRFDAAGARRFGEVTRQNVGKPFAIVLDNEVISAPVIREPILGGSGQISGNFTVQEANDLAILLRAGALPAPLEILEERTVGPGLGADSVRAGELASIIGLIAVAVFMIMSYGRFGIYANVSLFLNMFMIIGVLSGLQATLTLPGIAGIVLTIGMAVDANVLIYERIREELKAGKSPVTAIDTGYKRALSPILDANVTTLIAALVLFQFGSGPVRGFAVTLAIGVVTSVFTAYFVNRMLVALWYRRARPKALVL